MRRIFSNIDYCIFLDLRTQISDTETDEFDVLTRDTGSLKGSDLYYVKLWHLVIIDNKVPQL